MASLFVSALFVLTASGAPAPVEETDGLDLRCYRLMAELAEDDDPRVSTAGLTGAQYFLGRLDASAPRFDPGAAPAEALSDAEREQLVRRCGALMGEGGRNFRDLGQALTAPGPTI